MECDICGKSGSSHSSFHCITCARSYLEQPRIDLARTLIDKDGIEKHVKAIVQRSEGQSAHHVSLTDSKGGLLVDLPECTNNLNWQRTQAETAEIQNRLTLISEQADQLRAQMEATRKQLEVRRAANAQRKSDLSSVTYGIEARRANELDKIVQYTRRSDYKSDKTHQEITEYRMSLCTAAANLAGLKTSRRRNRNGSTKEVHNIGPGSRLRIWDLRDLNDASPDQLSASLASVAQLLVRVAAYSGIRLPAEITLPHSDYPQPTIFSPASSYQGKKVPFPGSTPSHSSTNSPEASRTLDVRHHHLPKPRSLFVDRPLSHLSAEDPPAYSSFIEGVSLLAYNVAWLCRTQGMKESFRQWEDICSMGRNLHRLLILQETYHPQRAENPLDKDHAAKSSSAAIRRTPVSFGQLSHTTAHSFIGITENAQYLGGWNISPTKIVDELKAYLLGEQQAQEWDVLNQKEWEDMENIIAEDPIVVGDKRRNNAGLDDGRSYLTSTTVNGRNMSSQKVDASEGEQSDRKRGTSGWTKLKSRPDELTKKVIFE